MSSQLSRRAFIKFASLAMLGGIVPTPFIGGADASSRKQTNAPNVLVLVFDAFSAKHASLYGYPRSTTPNMARFAERATVYHSHYAAGNFTTPGVASILTGTYPWSHRAFHLYGNVVESNRSRNLFSSLGSASYYTTAYTHNPAAMVLLSQFGADLDLLVKMKELALFTERLIAERVSVDEFSVALASELNLFHGRGRDGKRVPSGLFLSLLHRVWRASQRRAVAKEYVEHFPRGVPSISSGKMLFTLEHAIDWIEVQLKNLPQPWAAYYHLWPPHDPYLPRREFVGLFNDGWSPPVKERHFFAKKHSEAELNQKRREYDEYIAYADAEFGRLYDHLRSTGLLENTYLILTSDHGHMFERGIWGHMTPVLYESVIRIPLLISKPGQQQREDVYVPTSCVDLLPTLLHVAGQQIPDWCEGDILPTFSAQEPPGERSVFVVEAKSNPKRAPLNKGSVALIKGQYKLTHYFGYEGQEAEFELYDLANDPEEMVDLESSQKSVAAELKSALAEKLQQVNQPYLAG